MTVHVTKELAVETFEKVMEELGGDTIVDTCQVYEGYGRNKTPSCAVGQVYYRLVDEDSWVLNGNQGLPTLGWDLHLWDASFRDDTAAGYLMRLQVLQDRKMPWAEAHAKALDLETFIKEEY